MRIKLGIALGILFAVTPATFAQELQVNRENKTVEVTVTQKIEVEADTAKVSLEARTFGQSHDAAYQENLRIAGQVVKALLDAGTLKSRIETHGISSDTQAYSDLKELTPEEENCASLL